MQRPTAHGNQDWVVIGDAPGIFSLSRWLQALFRHHGQRRPDEQPFFVDHQQQRCYTYATLLADLRALWARAVGALVDGRGVGWMRGWLAGVLFRALLARSGPDA